MKPLSFDCAWHGLYDVQLLTSNLAAVDGAQWGEMFSRHLAGEKKIHTVDVVSPSQKPLGTNSPDQRIQSSLVSGSLPISANQHFLNPFYPICCRDPLLIM